MIGGGFGLFHVLVTTGYGYFLDDRTHNFDTEFLLLGC